MSIPLAGTSSPQQRVLLNDTHLRAVVSHLPTQYFLRMVSRGVERALHVLERHHVVSLVFSPTLESTMNLRSFMYIHGEETNNAVPLPTLENIHRYGDYHVLQRMLSLKRVTVHQAFCTMARLGNASMLRSLYRHHTRRPEMNRMAAELVACSGNVDAYKVVEFYANKSLESIAVLHNVASSGSLPLVKHIMEPTIESCLLIDPLLHSGITHKHTHVVDYLLGLRLKLSKPRLYYVLKAVKSKSLSMVQCLHKHNFTLKGVSNMHRQYECWLLPDDAINIPACLLHRDGIGADVFRFMHDNFEDECNTIMQRDGGRVLPYACRVGDTTMLRLFHAYGYMTICADVMVKCFYEAVIGCYGDHVIPPHLLKQVGVQENMVLDEFDDQLNHLRSLHTTPRDMMIVKDDEVIRLVVELLSLTPAQVKYDELMQHIDHDAAANTLRLLFQPI